MPPGQDYSSPGPAGEYGAGGSSGGIRRFFVFLRKHWWVPVLTLLLAGGGAIALILLTPPIYISTSAMYETEHLHLSEGVLFTEDASTYIGTQLELLKSASMGQVAIDRLRSLGTNGVPVDKDGLPLRVTLSFREAPKSTVFVITASSADPALSQNYLDALMSGYLDYKQEVRKRVAGETFASVARQVGASETNMKAALEDLTTFQRSNNLAILQEEGTGAGAHLEKLETELSDLQLQSKLLQATEVELKAGVPPDNSGGGSPADLLKDLGSSGQSAVNNTAQLTPWQEIALLKMQREKLSVNHRPTHPKVVALDAEIAKFEKLSEIFRGENREQLQARQEAINMRMTNVMAFINDSKSNVTEFSSRIAEAERLKQDLARDQTVSDQLNTLLRNVDITRNTDLETLEILEHASPAKRSYAGVIKSAVLVLFGGLAFGLGIVFLIEKRDDRFTSPIEVNSALGDAIVGLLPEVAQKGKEPMGLLEMNDSRHGYAESFRRLRSGLLFLATEGERPKVLLITSAMPNEGKSTVAANLARALALSGSSVLLVDGDLRRGSLHRLLKMQGEPGLAELLRRACEPDKVIQRDSMPNFAFVSCGDHSGNPGDLFLGSGLDQILARWRQEFDYVLIDSSPVFVADDASCLAPKVDGTLFVVRRGHSSARAVSEALDLLAQRQARVLGVIFNGADPSARNYYYDKYAHDKTIAKTA
jgi:capsular exopolysaccharide synthesis family protein